jgi:Flp pilus assembly protein TadD
MAQVPRSVPALYAGAQVAIGVSLGEDQRTDEALAAFAAARDATPNDPRITYLYASQLVQLKRYDEALELLNGPLLATADQGPEIRFMRGAAYESLGRISEAEAELWTALQAQPDEPVFLNYLGYLWVDSGTRVAEGAAMIARAHAANPEDGNIQDSLGWAQYRQGQFETAVETLEQAVAKEPANAEINDHLGDAYWQVGRRREAGFQWTRVLTLDPDAERRTEVERKLSDGLEAGGES